MFLFPGLAVGHSVWVRFTGEPRTLPEGWKEPGMGSSRPGVRAVSGWPWTSPSLSLGWFPPVVHRSERLCLAQFLGPRGGTSSGLLVLNA